MMTQKEKDLSGFVDQFISEATREEDLTAIFNQLVPRIEGHESRKVVDHIVDHVLTWRGGDAPLAVALFCEEGEPRREKGETDASYAQKFEQRTIKELVQVGRPVDRAGQELNLKGYYYPLREEIDWL